VFLVGSVLIIFLVFCVVFLVVSVLIIFLVFCVVILVGSVTQHRKRKR
jgi:flagellar basal body-associated protein FliL